MTKNTNVHKQLKPDLGWSRPSSRLHVSPDQHLHPVGHVAHHQRDHSLLGGVPVPAGHWPLTHRVGQYP